MRTQRDSTCQNCRLSCVCPMYMVNKLRPLHMRTKQSPNCSRMVHIPYLCICRQDCKHVLHHLRMVRILFATSRNICRIFAQTQRELDALYVLCLPRVCRKLIYRVPSANCLRTVTCVPVFKSMNFSYTV